MLPPFSKLQIRRSAPCKVSLVDERRSRSHLAADCTLRGPASRSLPMSTWVPSLRAIHLDPGPLRWDAAATRWERGRM